MEFYIKVNISYCMLTKPKKKEQYISFFLFWAFSVTQHIHSKAMDQEQQKN